MWLGVERVKLLLKGQVPPVFAGLEPLLSGCLKLLLSDLSLLP